MGTRVHAGVVHPDRAMFVTHYPVNCADSEIQTPASDTLVDVHARSALFDLYGDHLIARGGWAPIAAVVGLLGGLDITAPAVRTAVSRMVREGWQPGRQNNARSPRQTEAPQVTNRVPLMLLQAVTCDDTATF